VSSPEISGQAMCLYFLFVFTRKDPYREYLHLLIRVNVAEVCDARDDDSSTAARNKKCFKVTHPEASKDFLLRFSYCASDILTCKPPLVLVIGKALLIFGIFLFCSK